MLRKRVLPAVLILVLAAGVLFWHPWVRQEEYTFSTLISDDSQVNRRACYALFEQMEQEQGAFMVNAYNYHAVDDEGTPLYTQRDYDYEPEMGPDGTSIEVSRNYFNYNPIRAAGIKPVEKQLVFDDYVLNLLVPEKYRDREEEIVEAYREDFFWDKAMPHIPTGAHTSEEIMLEDLPDGSTRRFSIEDLSVNVIWVKNGQKYFTYSSDCAVDTDNWVTDPVVKVYTGNINLLYIRTMIAYGHVFFEASAGEEVEALVKQNLLSNHLKVQPAEFEEESISGGTENAER